MARIFVRSRITKGFAAASQMLESVQKRSYRSTTDPSITIADLDAGQIDALAMTEGVEIIRPTRYEPLSQTRAQVFLPAHSLSMRDVMAHNKAQDAWAVSRGAGVHIAIVDTGICGSMAEFPAANRSPYSWAPDSSTNPWEDIEGHGSMTAAAAAATSAHGGRYDGVAPDAKLIACRTSFDDTELYEIYEYLIGLVDSGKVERLVINNSYGAYRCDAPYLNRTDPFPSLVTRAVSKGIVVVFAAGNNHVYVCGKDPKACEPNTIWGVNSFDEVISVGTVDEHNRMDKPPLPGGKYSHRDSSRGPGQFAVKTTKPDVVAPTYGEVVWGCGYEAMEWWGTSGAAPQVAGLAALMLSRNPTLTAGDIQRIIRETCVSLPLAPTCAGAGLIDCLAAVGRC